ncbi:helix-turn-helix domain-containing protein [Rhizobacter sp. J219]|uniref:helix-turn-helix domain-containing protein n=1 Tax=Rhizobacter sp. J219 TaxID=2898430 RepID=UPI002150B80A|nr:helix-turn-helix transcriptional regulator [Rhizobacter sp. J219]MCR5881867.1 helix-turn-helix domain-containing protein [Rhizobacter sp. J219]
MRKSIYRRHNQVFLGLLRRYREKGRFRQSDLAQHLGSVQGTVSKAETGNRRLDVIELREWLLAMGADFLEFMTELHEQLEALPRLDPWLLPPIASHKGNRERNALSALKTLSSDSLLSSDVDDELAGERSDVRPANLQRHADALAKLFAPMVRVGLSREVAGILAELQALKVSGRPLEQWFGQSPSDIAQDLAPNEDEIGSVAAELARLLLSNWLELWTHASRRRCAVLIGSAQRIKARLPMEVTTRLSAFPVSQEDACELLVSYLRSTWNSDPSH